jgi:lipoteichoic acid synthase
MIASIVEWLEIRSCTFNIETERTTLPSTQHNTALPASAPTSGARLSQLIGFLPIALFISWMLVKQHIALTSIGLEPGPFMALATGGTLLLISPLLLRRLGSAQVGRMLWLNGAITLLVQIDMLYFRHFSDIVSVASLRFAGQVASVSTSVTALFHPADLLLWIDIPLIALVALYLRRAGRWLPSPVLRWRTASGLALVGLFVVGMAAVWDPLLSRESVGHAMVATRMGLLNYHLVDLGAYASRMTAHLAPVDDAYTEVEAWLEERPRTAPADLHGVAAGHNVIVLQVESLQAFTLGLRIDGQEVTPHMNRLAGQSLHFTDFYAQTGQGVTADADLLANCSLYPSRTGAVYYDFAENEYRCMPTVLREHSYKAFAMQGMPARFWNLMNAYPQVGFEHYYNLADLELDEQIGLGLSDESFLRQAADKLGALPEPYYAFLVTLTNHTPFDFPEIPKQLDLGELEGTKTAAYLHAVHYTDAAVGKFVARLEAEGTLDRSVLLLYGDHMGIDRNTPGLQELLQIEPHNEVALTRAEHRVPFLIRLPGAAAAGERPHAAGEIDIAPTLLGLLGLPQERIFMGRDLLAEPGGTVAFYQGSALSDQHLFIATGVESSMGLCYDRQSGEAVSAGHCLDLAADAARRLRISRLIVERNLIGQLVGGQEAE